MTGRLKTTFGGRTLALALALVMFVGGIAWGRELPPAGLYVANRADVTVTGEPCGIGTPLAPPYLLRVGALGEPGTEPAVAVLLDDAGVAMPLVPRADGAFDVVDASEPRGTPDYVLGTATPGDAPLTLAVDFRRYELACRVRGTLTFAPTSDPALALRIDRVLKAWLAMGVRDTRRNAGDSRGAFEPARAAEALMRDALGPTHRLTWAARAKVASLHWDLDEFEPARRLGEASIAGLTAALGPDHIEVLQARQNLALVLWDEGELGEAETMLRDVADRYAVVLDPDDGKRLGTLTNLATLIAARGRHVEAENILRDIVSRRERIGGPTHPTTLVTINNLASAYAAAGWLDEAVAQFRVILERYEATLGPRHPATLRARHNLATMIARRGDHDAAAAELREVLRLRREVLGDEHGETTTSQTSLATVLADQDRIDEALALQREVVALRTRISGPQSTVTLLAQGGLGRIESRAGLHADAVARLRDTHAKAVATLGPNAVQTVQFAALLGYAQRDAGDLAGARATLADVVAAVERWRDAGALTAARRAALFAPWARAYKELAFVARELGDAGGAFDQAERSKARVLVEALALRRGETTAILPREALDGLAKLDARVAALEAEHATADAAKRVDIAQALAIAAGEAAAQRASLRDRYPKYAALSQARLVSAREGAAELAPGSVFVSYLVQDERVLAFVVQRGGRLRAHDLGRIEGLAPLVTAYRTLLAAQPGSEAVWRTREGRFVTSLAAPEGVTRVRDAREPGALLHARLVAPIRELGAARRWVVSPDGPLALIPFEALPEGGRPLVATREIRYAPSLTVYAQTARRGRDYARAAGRAPLYAMGGAIYTTTPPAARAASTTRGIDGARLTGALTDDALGTRRAYDRLGARWPELPGSLIEIERVASGFRGQGNVLVRARADATEARLRQDDRAGMLARYRYVLLAAHGYLSTEAPGLSAVVLGQQDVTPEDDGYVTAGEWTAYTLRSDLIVVSACETGVGRIIEGEGVAGLPYALFVAGNRNALLTLWPVADASSAAFVARFFVLLRAGRTQADALATTKREFAARGRFRDAAHWAPFVLWGS